MKGKFHIIGKKTKGNSEQGTSYKYLESKSTYGSAIRKAKRYVKRRGYYCARVDDLKHEKTIYEAVDC